MTREEMLEAYVNKVSDAKNYVSEHTDEAGTLSAEDAQIADKMIAEAENLNKEIDRMDRLNNLEDVVSTTSTTPLVGDITTGTATDAYSSAMERAMRTGFRKVDNVLQESVDADGGYLIPETWDSRIIDTLDDANIMRQVATIITTEGLHRINIAGDKPSAAWLEEGQALTFTDAKFDQTTLDAYKLAVAVKVTEELLYDNKFGLQNYITTSFGRAIGQAEEEAMLVGEADAKTPTGLFVSGTDAGTVALTADALINLLYALKRPYRPNAAFIMNDALVAQIRTLKDNNGAYMWQPSYQDGEPDRILGYKVYTSAYAPTDKIAFGDFSYYNIGDRGNRTMSELHELYAENGMIGFTAKERIDGKLVLPEAVQILTIEAAEG